MLSGHTKQLSDGNGDGTVMGQSATDLIAFFGGTPTAQRAGGNQVTVSQGGPNGVVINVNSVALTPTNVSTISTAAVVLTLTGASIQSNDHIVINKITNTQAGLGIAYARAGTTASTVVVQYVNLSAGVLTPTASESYTVVALRGLANTATLSPALVASNSCVEQQFTVAGLAPGMLVNVIKPTDQAGLAIAGFRVVSNNTLGITFLNPTTTGITPTANEAYSYINLNGLAPVGNMLTFGCNIGTLNSTVSTSVIEQTLTVTGIAANDIALGPMMRATFQSSSVPIMSRITAANAVGISILNYSGVAGVTPTANEVWQLSVNRMQPLAPLTNYSVSLTPAAVGPNTTTEQGFTVTGLVAGTAVLVNNLAPTSGLGIVGYRVSAANVLAITFANPTSATITPPTANYLVGNFQNLIGSTGCQLAQPASAVQNATISLLNEVRAALAPTTGVGMIAGA